MFEIGNEVAHPLHGVGKVMIIHHDETYPVVVTFGFCTLGFTKDGREDLEGDIVLKKISQPPSNWLVHCVFSTVNNNAGNFTAFVVNQEFFSNKELKEELETKIGLVKTFSIVSFNELSDRQLQILTK